MTPAERGPYPPGITKINSIDLSGKVAIVTGSSRGIGQAIALKLGKHGANIVVSSTERSIPQAEEVKSQIESFGQKAFVFTGDVSQEEIAINIALETIKNFGRIDILVNNAGTRKDKLLIRMSLDEWNGVIKTNLTSTFLMTREVLKQMLKLKTGGSIINISSVVGQVGNPGQANYGVSKAGMINLTKTCAQEYERKGIRFNTLALGLVEETDLVKDVTEKQKEEILKKTSRFITKEEVAEQVLYLASDKATGITGTTITIDGGIIKK